MKSLFNRRLQPEVCREKRATGNAEAHQIQPPLSAGDRLLIA